MTSSSPDTLTQIKIYVDGFRIDTIDLPKLCDDIIEVAMTPKVKESLEDKEIDTIIPVPKANPRFVMITTKLHIGDV